MSFGLGLADDQELHQYVLYDAAPIQKGPKRINLNDGLDKDKAKTDSKYSPPTSLTIHLSKIDMPELQPRANPSTVANTKPNNSGNKGDKKDKAAREAEEKRRREEKKGLAKPAISCVRANEFATAQGSKFAKTSSPSRIHSNQIYPGQPSPSPSQLNNPGIYTAPPPRPPHSPYSHPYPQPGPPPSNSPSFYGAGSYSLRPSSAGANLGVPGALNTQPTGSYPGGPPLVQGQRPTTPSPATAATAVVSSLLDKFWHKP